MLLLDKAPSTLDLMVDSTNTNFMYNLAFKTKLIWHTYIHTHVHTMRNDPEVIIDQSGDKAISRTGRSQSSGIGRDGDRPC